MRSISGYDERTVNELGVLRHMGIQRTVPCANDHCVGERGDVGITPYGGNGGGSAPCGGEGGGIVPFGRNGGGIVPYGCKNTEDHSVFENAGGKRMRCTFKSKLSGKSLFI